MAKECVNCGKLAVDGVFCGECLKIEKAAQKQKTREFFSQTAADLKAMGLGGEQHV